MTMRRDDRLIEARSLLGVGPKDDMAMLRAAFRRSSMETHPDRGGSVAKFRDVKDAYVLLLNNTATPAAAWLLESTNEPIDIRVVDEARAPRRRRFEEMFLEALKREHDD